MNRWVTGSESASNEVVAAVARSRREAGPTATLWRAQLRIADNGYDVCGIYFARNTPLHR